MSKEEVGDGTATCRSRWWLGSPVVPFALFSLWVALLKPKSRKQGTLILKGLLGNLGGG